MGRFNTAVPQLPGDSPPSGPVMSAPVPAAAERRAALSVPLWILAVLVVLMVNRVYATLDWSHAMVQMGSVRAAYTILLLDEIGLAATVVLLAAIWPARLRVLGVALFVVFAVAYWIDVQVLKALWHRLTIPYIEKYAQHPGPIAWFYGPRRIVRNLLLVGLPAGLIFRYLRHRRLTLARGRRSMIVALGLLASLAVLPWTDVYCRVHNRSIEYFTRNLARFNAGVALRRGTDAATADRLRTAFPQVEAGVRALNVEPAAAPPGGHRRNVVVVISESLSRVDSRRSGGFYDRLPLIDQIQADGMTLTNVACDGEATDDALASLLVGVPGYSTSLMDLDMPERFPVGRGSSTATPALGRNLARRARASSYTTAFLSNAPLAMDANDAWINSLGFQRVVGGGSPEFTSEPRFSFDMPADQALYRLALDHLGRSQPTPSLTVLLTMSLHAPYVLPDSQDVVAGGPLLSQLHYVDRTTYEFYARLRASGFFQDGVLLLVGDHRRMTPFEPEEERLLGVDATGRIVATLVGAGVPAGLRTAAVLNQSDLFALLYDLVDGRAIGDLQAYAKARQLGIPTPFAVTSADGEYGIFTIRRPGVLAREVMIRPWTEPQQVVQDPIDRQIVAFISLQSYWLQAAQLSPGARTTLAQ